MPSVQEEKLIVEGERKYFVCIFLNDDGQCLAKKHKCSQDRKDEKCRQVEDTLQ